MKYYLVPAASGYPPTLEATQDEAKATCRNRGLPSRAYELYVVPDGKDERMAFVNELLLFTVQMPATSPAPTPPPPSTLSESEPAPLKQETVDGWFEPQSKRPKPTLDEVCACIASYEGAALGHVAHELAARIQRLADFVKEAK